MLRHTRDLIKISSQSTLFQRVVAQSNTQLRLQWNSAVCHKGTISWASRLIILSVVGMAGLPAQSLPDWRKVGGASMDFMLAAPGTGPVDHVWFAPEGSVLYARTHSGLVFRTGTYTLLFCFEGGKLARKVQAGNS